MYKLEFERQWPFRLGGREIQKSSSLSTLRRPSAGVVKTAVISDPGSSDNPIIHKGDE